MSSSSIKWLLCATFLYSHPAYAAETEATIPADPASFAAAAFNKLTLEAAIEKVLTSSPRMKSAEAGILASKGGLTQAGLWHNPELSIESENFAGNGRYSSFDSSETTFGVSQTIEMGSKRSGRKAVAEQEVSLSRLGHVNERLDIIHDATVAYVNVVAAMESLKLTQEQKELASHLFDEVRERVDAAREPLIQKSKAEITVSTANFAYARAERELNHAKHVLSSLWGGHDADFDLEKRDFFTLTIPMTEEEAEKLMEKNPGLIRYQANHGRMQAKYELEKSAAIPDPRFNVGVRDLRDSGDQAVVAGISIPIPVLNRNQGNIEKARHEVSKAESDAEAMKLSMIGELHESLEAQINAFEQAESLKSSILPAAENAFTLSRQGYRAGKFPYFEVLDAQRTLFDVKEQYIESLNDYHTAKANVERLAAIRVETTESKEEAHAE